MTEYVVLVKGKGEGGFKVYGHAEAHNGEQAQEKILGTLPGVPPEGEVASVPARSWEPRQYVLKQKTALEFG